MMPSSSFIQTPPVITSNNKNNKNENIQHAYNNVEHEGALFSTSVPIKRNYQFHLPNCQHWHADGVLMSQFFNALSIFFPPGETMFVEAVRAHKPRLFEKKRVQEENEKEKELDTLRAAVSGFIVQECIHSREHQLYNEALIRSHGSVEYMSRVVELLTRDIITKQLPTRLAMLVTIALEHWTAILSGALLDVQEQLLRPDSNAAYCSIWKWHAMEETEHKAVAYDVYEYCYPKTMMNYVGRCISYAIVSLLFWWLVTSFFVILIVSDGPSVFLSPKEWSNFLWSTWINPGTLRRTIVPFFRYFSYDFHPWRAEDNRHHLLRFAQLNQEVHAIMDGAVEKN